MTTTSDDRDTAGPPPPRPDVTLLDVVGAAWIRHRRTLLGGSALVVALAVVIEVFARLGTLSASGVGQLVQYVGLVALLTGVLLGAPLVSREYDHGTHVWAWGQDASPVRWLTGTCVLFAGFAVAWALVLGFAAQDLVPDELLRRDFAFTTLFFDASPLVQVGRIVFALAVGVLFSVLVRRTAAAMVLTLVTLFVAQTAVLLAGRESYLPAVRDVVPVGVVPTPAERPVRGLEVASGYLDAAGRASSFPPACRPTPTAECLRDNGLVASFSDYQPADRLLAHQLVETGLYLGAALVIIVVTVLAMRRLTRR